MTLNDWIVLGVMGPYLGLSVIAIGLARRDRRRHAAERRLQP